MKRVMASVSILALLLAACGGDPAASDTPSSDTPSSEGPAASAPDETEEIVLEFPTWQADEPGVGDFWKGAIEAFEAENPGVTINLTFSPFADHSDSLVTQFSAGQPPDIIHMQGPDVPSYASEGWLEPLDDWLADTDIFESWTPIQEQLKFEDQYYGLLLFAFPWVLYYNEELLDAKSVAAPTTTEELIEAIAAFDGDSDVFGYLTATSSDPNTFAQGNAWITGNGGSFVLDGEPTATDQAVVDALDLYRSATENTPAGMTADQARTLFIDGSVAFYIDGAFFNGFINNDADPELRPSLQVVRAPFPQIAGSVSNNIAIPSDIPEDHKQAAANFIKLIASPEWQQQYMELLQVPAPRVGTDSEEVPDATRLFAELNADAVGTVPNDTAVRLNFGQYQNAIIDAFTRAQTTDDPSGDILAELNDRLASVLSE